MSVTKFIYHAARVIAAIILLQTLYFKFTAAPESVYIFTTVGMEPWGRIGVGVVEAVASALLLATPLAWVGAGLALGLMAGAMGMHFTWLGIEVQGDGGYLFFLALAVALCSSFVLWSDQDKVLQVMEKYLGRKNQQ
ncbi:MAG: DoxX family protein [Cyclobacteriaceae bacterium]|nr:DoxX family protein [Cyclobacteriaceae bacterium]